MYAFEAQKYACEESPILIVIEKIILRKGRGLWKMYITITLKLGKLV